jgi:predicted RNase H-like nuclease (RuvC/YqgF family)
MDETVEDSVEESTEETAEVEANDDVVIDLEAAEEEAVVEQLREQVEEQREQIEELNGLLLDLSSRAAHTGGMGVCPDCHGPVTKIKRWVRTSTIECTRCGRVFHEY